MIAGMTKTLGIRINIARDDYEWSVCHIYLYMNLTTNIVYFIPTYMIAILSLGSLLSNPTSLYRVTFGEQLLQTSTRRPYLAPMLLQNVYYLCNISIKPTR